MKIIIAHYKYYIQGGPERYMLKFMELAKKNGHDVVPFSISYDRNMQSDYSEYFVSTASKDGMYDSSNKSLKYLAEGVCREFHNREAYLKLRRLIRDEKPDLLYVLIPGELTADIFKAAQKENVPVILRLSDFRLLCGSYSLLRGEEICEECIHGKYGKMCKNRCIKGSRVLSALRATSLWYNRRRKIYNSVDAVIAPPQFTVNKFVEAGFFSPQKMYSNATFIDCSNIHPSAVSRNYVLCLGRFSPEKGFIYVVEAMRYLKDIPVSVAVTGDKENCDAKLKEIIEKYELQDKVNFVGFVHGETLEKTISEAMCVACPAIWYENMPNTIIEAYAYGKPVIASKIGSLEEMIEDGKTGLLFEPKNVKEIADCIRRLYENPEQRVMLGENARKKCEIDYSPEKHWENFLKIFNKIKQ